MKIAFYDTKPYDRIWFEPLAAEYGYKIKFFDYKLHVDTAPLSAGYDVVCAFVNDIISDEVIDILHKNKIGLLAMRCAGYNNVDIKAAEGKIRVVRVPSYSPAAVAEHAAALLLSVNRKTYRAYIRTRDNNFSINGLMGIDLKEKAVGIIGTGKIGQVFADIAHGFRMRVLAYDPYPAQGLDVEYTTLDDLIARSDVISLHCPLTKDTHHIINNETIEKMKDGVILINTSRGALVNTDALLEGLKSKKIGGAGLDVYEEESDYFFEDLSNDIIPDDDLARLLSFPNVLITSHQAFFTREAMQAIAIVTMENIHTFETGGALDNEVVAH
ncbi:MAG: 2-hydroxyacid dehydrogenase [Oscillospiraceae bacterium]|jgi:D-lactate dehydrogenase|nr:2-hydroxyacid dehydrogenase [Oscillospiraceae bacterium]